VVVVRCGSTTEERSRRRFPESTSPGRRTWACAGAAKPALGGHRGRQSTCWAFGIETPAARAASVRDVLSGRMARPQSCPHDRGPGVCPSSRHAPRPAASCPDDWAYCRMTKVRPTTAYYDASDGARIAYHVTGAGSMELVWLAGIGFPFDLLWDE